MGTRYQGNEQQGANSTRGAYNPFIARMGTTNAGQAPESVARLHDQVARPADRLSIGYPASKVRAAD